MSAVNDQVFFCPRCGHSHRTGPRVKFSYGTRLYESAGARCEQVIDVISLDAWRQAIARHDPARLTEAGRAALAPETQVKP